MSTKYLIADEPRPSKLSQHVVNPQWPMLAQMLAGSWLALPWFLFNSIALGSPNWKKDLGWILVSLIGSLLLLLAIEYAIDLKIITGIWAKMSFLAIVALRLWVAYSLFFSQSSVFELWQYYGGIEKNGLILLMLASFLIRPFIDSSVDGLLRFSLL
jgi:hypothetical protein